jgi:hypothetical protein
MSRQGNCCELFCKASYAKMPRIDSSLMSLKLQGEASRALLSVKKAVSK